MFVLNIVHFYIKKHGPVHVLPWLSPPGPPTLIPDEGPLLEQTSESVFNRIGRVEKLLIPSDVGGSKYAFSEKHQGHHVVSNARLVSLSTQMVYILLCGLLMVGSM